MWCSIIRCASTSASTLWPRSSSWPHAARTCTSRPKAAQTTCLVPTCLFVSVRLFGLPLSLAAVVSSLRVLRVYVKQVIRSPLPAEASAMWPIMKPLHALTNTLIYDKPEARSGMGPAVDTAADMVARAAVQLYVEAFELFYARLEDQYSYLADLLRKLGSRKTSGAGGALHKSEGLVLDMLSHKLSGYKSLALLLVRAAFLSHRARVAGLTPATRRTSRPGSNGQRTCSRCCCLCHKVRTSGSFSTSDPVG